MTEDGDVNYSFLRRPLRASWADVGAAMLTPPAFDSDTATFTGAAYRIDGSLVLESLRPSAIGHWRPVDPVTRASYPREADVDIKAAIYGGHFFAMWGHFLLESLSTAAVADHMPDVPVVFTPFAPDPGGHVVKADLERRRELIAAAGWGRRPILLQTGEMTFGRLIVPERLSVYAGSFHARVITPEMATVYTRLRTTLAPDIAPSVRIVARRPKGSSRAHPEEEEVYAALEAQGFLIVDGASLAPADQVRAFAQASLLVGFTGSNLHASVFCHPGVPVLELGDVRSYQSFPERRNRNQIAMCELLNQRHEFVETFSDGSPLSCATIVEDVNRSGGISAG